MVKYKKDKNIGNNMKGLIIALLFLMVAPMVSSLDNLGTFQQNDSVRITQVCADATYINISSISLPNSTLIVSNIAMTEASSKEFYYNLANTYTQQLGRYDVRGISDGCERTFATYFDVTSNGKEAPQGIVITTFFLLFLVILLFTAYIILSSVGHAVTLDFDIIDLAWNYGLFFAILGMKIGENSWLGSVEIANYLNWAIDIGIWVLIILPTIYFIVTLTVGSILAKRIKGVDY